MALHAAVRRLGRTKSGWGTCCRAFAHQTSSTTEIAGIPMEVRHRTAWAVCQVLTLHRHTFLDQIGPCDLDLLYCFRCMAQTTTSVSL